MVPAQNLALHKFGLQHFYSGLYVSQTTSRGALVAFFEIVWRAVIDEFQIYEILVVAQYELQRIDVAVL